MSSQLRGVVPHARVAPGVSQPVGTMNFAWRMARKVVEYIALNDTRPPDNQAINMCHGHSVLGLNWQESPRPSPTQSLEKRGLKRPAPSGPVSSGLPWATTQEAASTSQIKRAGVDGSWAESSAMSTDFHNEAHCQDLMEGGSDSADNAGNKKRAQQAIEVSCQDMWGMSGEGSEMRCGGSHGKEEGEGGGGGGMSWLEHKQRGGSDAGSELSAGKGGFSTRNRAGKHKARRTYGR